MVGTVFLFGVLVAGLRAGAIVASGGRRCGPRGEADCLDGGALAGAG